MEKGSQTKKLSHPYISALAGTGLSLALLTGCGGDNDRDASTEVIKKQGDSIHCADSRFIEATGKSDYLVLRIEDQDNKQIMIESARIVAPAKAVDTELRRRDDNRFELNLNKKIVGLSLQVEANDLTTTCAVNIRRGPLEE